MISLLTHPKWSSEQKRFAVVLIIIASLAFGITHVQHYEPETGSDAVHYFFMSENPSNMSDVKPPFKYRVLTPLLVSAIKSATNLPTWRAFYVLNYFALFFSSVILYLFLRRLKFNEVLSLIGVSIFLSNYIIVGLSVFLVDPLFFLFYIAGIYFILKKKFRYTLLCLIVGIFNKETILLLIPYYLVIRFSPYIAYTLFSIFIPYFLWFRKYVAYTSYLEELITNPIRKIIYAATSFSLLWILAPFGYKNANPFIKKSVFFLPFVFSLWLLATNLDRMTFLSFPVLIPLVLQVVKDNLGSSS